MLERSPPQVAEITRAEAVATGRRVLFAVLFAATFAGMMALMAAALSAGGFGVLDFVILALFALTLPWMVIGFWNAVIGFLILRLADPSAAVVPVAAGVTGHEPITASTAILLCIRNEAPERMVRNLEPTLAGLAAAGASDRFHVYVLSDTDDAGVAAKEEARFAALASAWRERIAIIYRRRDINTGYKAGNIRDFCERWGAQHEFAVVLDADSFMTAEAILRLVRIMQADPNLGILQGLVVGLPSTSAFARLFQFGMRLGMRSYTIGNAWWQGDCGPYWGHNAVLRLEPFIAHCRLPTVDDDHILSHDQLEAALMRRAGYGVRVLPEESSWEENPPTLIEFLRRDLRWCQGNMQYWRFLGFPGLKAVNRHNLVVAILMFVGSPAWIGMLVFGTLSVALAATPADVHPSRLRHGVVRVGAGDVVCAQDRDGHRHPAARRRAARLRRHRAVSWPMSSSNTPSPFCWCRSNGSATPFSWAGCCSAARSAGSDRRATTTPCRRRWRCATCGRTRCSVGGRSARWPRRIPKPSPMRYSSPPARRWPSRSRSARPCPRSAAR